MTNVLMALLATSSPTRAQFSGLTGAQLSGLTGAQLSGLTRAQLSGLTGNQLSGLTRAQLSVLTRKQLSGLTGDLAVPKVERLYSSMAADLAAKKRVLQQSTFGPHDPGANVCDTPMCIAGHTVHLAGEAGYTLMRRLGFAGAAALIHHASRPDVSAPRYDSYPDEWALAYIEARAAEEALESGNEEFRK